MEKKIYKTLVRGNHPLGNDDYILGRITGVEFMICDYDPKGPCYGLDDLGDGWVIITSECTKYHYKAFRDKVNEMYPGLCIFSDID